MKNVMKNVMIVTGAGQISLAIAQRMGAGMKIVVGDKVMEHAQTFCETLNSAGFDAEPPTRLPMWLSLS